ncbi:MAG TPA: DUF1926 domain-containing protein [Pirellulaceae bacterium]|nr:DUF1926 domain-containing protein [Pirellulaceae bacterium]HMO91731.1 DUF1926 domain-containing protein [Pirellulaceae bacterium]HMP69806.1 DUF1926 domain-containing protein [Pirellulaceae bacterium]
MSDSFLRLCLVLHNHQPVGNFDGVFEQAFQDSYLPFLDVFESFSELKITLHLSGPLAKWLDKKHPTYLDRVADLVEAGRIEIIGGPFYEPILTMLPTRDRIGQIKSYTEWLQERFQAQVDGMWIPERVWEAALTRDLVSAGIRYSLLDDFHFINAGISANDLHGYFITEDEGHIFRIFPGSEKLRYLIPFAEPQASIDYLREKSAMYPGAVYAFGDDGEKFGTWPETKKHVYEDGWLSRFFECLQSNRDWLRTCTMREAIMSTPPLGKIYIPNGSYREMTEWSYPVARQSEFHRLETQLHEHEQWPAIRTFMQGGFWRNFKTKYAEANELYARMMFVSSWLNQAVQEGRNGISIDTARDHLYSAQCNCAYWHGAFGGIYLPHLRNAVYHHLIKAEAAINLAYNRDKTWIEASADDFDFDGHPEVRLANDQFTCWLSPSRGGILYELDVASIAQNLLATMQRRPEVYHEKVAAGEQEHHDEAASIHDRVVFKQAGLEKHLIYDNYPRKSMVDHFWDDNIALEQLTAGTALERGDFAESAYHAKIRRKQDRIQVQMTRSGNAWGVPLSITKGITLTMGSSQIEIAYLIEGIPVDRLFRFAVEFNFSALPANHDDRWFRGADGQSLGHLGTRLDLNSINQISLVDGWQKLMVTLNWDQVGSLWTFPIATVSQSEAGFELVHQSVVVQPNWLVSGDANGRWATRMTMDIERPPTALLEKVPQRQASESENDQDLSVCR